MAEMIYAKTKNILLDELKTGMMIDQDIFSGQGSVLIPKGRILTEPERVIEILRSHGIQMLKVRISEMVPDAAPAAEPEQTQQDRQVIEFMETFDDKCEMLKSEFKRIMINGELKKDELEERINETLSAFDADINVMQLMQKVRNLDDATYAHSHNVALTSHLIGRWMKKSEVELRELTLTALFIDIGKMKVASKIMNKKGALLAEEYLLAQKHVQYSYEAIKDFEFLPRQVVMGVLHHHERMDGSGYPLGLRGEEIPEYARIVAVADVYNALTSVRPYRPKKTPFEAARVMETEFNGLLDPEVLYLFLNRIGNLFIGQKIRLEDGRSGEIIFVPKQNIYRPMIRIDNDQEVIDLNQPAHKHLLISDFS
jgi:HD-GYP domain-containing protein (c-di-GMP phosphodiesterase class II)